VIARNWHISAMLADAGPELYFVLQIQAMRLRKWPFLLLIWLLAISPLVIYKMWWVLTATHTKGRVLFHGKELMGQLQRVYSVINYAAGSDTSYFNSSSNVLLPKGQVVDVLYHPDDLQGARMTDFGSLFNDMTIPAGVLFTMALLIGLHKHIIPRNALFDLRLKKPFLSMIELERI